MSKLELFVRRGVARMFSQVMTQRMLHHRSVAEHFFDVPSYEFVEKHPRIGFAIAKIWWGLCQLEIALSSFVYRVCFRAFMKLTTKAA